MKHINCLFCIQGSRAIDIVYVDVGISESPRNVRQSAWPVMKLYDQNLRCVDPVLGFVLDLLGLIGLIDHHQDEGIFSGFFDQ